MSNKTSPESTSPEFQTATTKPATAEKSSTEQDATVGSRFTTSYGGTYGGLPPTTRTHN